MSALVREMTTAVSQAPMVRREGRVTSFNGLVIEAVGPDAHVGELCQVARSGATESIDAEVVGFRDGRVLLMPFGSTQGISIDSTVRASGALVGIPVGPELLGRVVDAFSQPLDDGGAIRYAETYPLYRDPINPLARAPIDTLLETGVRAIDSMLTLAEGQRVGIFAGSGVGKSTLLGMLARHVSADVTVLGLIGERGREVDDFVRHSLGPEGQKRSVVVAATSDQPALVRAHAAHATHAIAEFFRDQGHSVLLIVDSMTRFATAQREIGLAVGEPPTFRGYTPSVFSQLPRMLERCGRVKSGGSITGIYSVLVEGDDMNEPVTDHMRSILDGHIVLTRDLAARGHHPAIDPLQSVSRLMSQVASSEEQACSREVRRLLAAFESSRDLVELGAHQRGMNPLLDQAVDMKPLLDNVFVQQSTERTSRTDSYRQLNQILLGARAS